MRRLCYVSQANFPLPQHHHHLTDILTEARDFNVRHHIQGVLYFADGRFLQCLEGLADDLERLVTRLQGDPRHHSMQMIMNQPINGAIFAAWSMKFVSRHHRVKQFFQQQGHTIFCPKLLNKSQLAQLLELLYQLEAQNLVA